MDKVEIRDNVPTIFLLLSAIATHVFSGIGFYILYGAPAVVVSSFMPGIGWVAFLVLWLNRWDTVGSHWVFWAFVGCVSCVVVCLCFIGLYRLIEITEREIAEESKQNMDLEPSTAG